MKSFWKWLLIFVGVLVAAFLVALPFFTRLGRVAVAPMIMMGGFHRSVGFGFGGGLLMMLGMALGWVLVTVLIVLGIVVLVRGSRNQPVQSTQGAVAATPAVEPEPLNTCARCGKPLQSDWVSCPYCGKKVK
jgi:hypothetical protein